MSIVIQITIIIAAYNANTCIAGALDSVLAQQYADWECLVVDGASTDGTQQTVRGYQQRDARFRLLSEPDRGIYDAFNKGVHEARGEWIYFLGADDRLMPDAFDRLLTKDVSRLDLLYGDVDYNNSYGIVHRASHPDPQSIRRFMPSHQAFVMRRSTILNLNGFDHQHYRLCADYHLVLRAILNGAPTQYRPVTICLFDTTGASSAYRMNLECYLIRQKLHSVTPLVNLYLLAKTTLLMVLRRLKAKL